MWITTKDIKNLTDQLIALKKTNDSLQQQINTLRIDTQGISCGPQYNIAYTKFGGYTMESNKLPLTKVVQKILTHLKLELTETPAIEADISLTKCKPTKK